MAERVRAQKVIARAGLMSRRSAEEAIAKGRVKLNGRTAVLGDRLNPEADSLTLDNVPVSIHPGHETYLLYKPLGVISTTSDPQGRQTVVDLVESRFRLYPVGRLDADTEGLLLLTNDGDLTHRVTHPSFGVTKTYVAIVNGRVDRSAGASLTAGVELEDGPARAVQAVVQDSGNDRSIVRIKMIEGRNREVRRLMSAIGHDVVSLARVAIGSLVDKSLKPGQSRLLQPSEIRRVFDDHD